MRAMLIAATGARHVRRALPGLLCLCVCLGASAGGPTRAKPATHTVVIDGVQFSPASLHAKVGDTVVWVNKDPFPHTATAAGKFDSGSIASGAKWRYKLKAKGSISYICSFHPNMLATIVVE